MSVQYVIPELPSLNFEETIIFYTKKLDFTLVKQFQELLIFVKDSCTIHFWLCTDKNIPENSSCYLLVKNIEVLYRSYLEKEIIHPNGLLTQPWQMKEFYVIDIHGNLLKFGEPVSIPL